MKGNNMLTNYLQLIYNFKTKFTMIDKNLLLIIIVALIFSGVIFGLFKHMKEGFGAYNLKVYGITIVIGFTILLALSDIEQSKLTPCYSILSAFAGYLFGIKGSENDK